MLERGEWRVRCAIFSFVGMDDTIMTVLRTLAGKRMRLVSRNVTVDKL